MEHSGGRRGDPSARGDRRAAAHVALAVNGMGSFTWDVPSGVMHYDDAALAVMGFRPGEFDGRLSTLGERMVPAELPAVQARVERALRERSGFSLYFRVRHPSGWLRWTHTQGHVVCDAQRRPLQVIGIVRDASHELRAIDQTEQLRQARQDRRRQADIVAHISDALMPTVTVDDVADALTSARLLERLGASSIVLGLVDDGRMELIGSNGLSRRLVRDFHLSRLDQPLPLTEAVRTREPVFITDRDELTERYPALLPYLKMFSRATAAMYQPLIAHDTPIGALGLTFDGKGSFTQDERTVLNALGKVVAQSLQRALLYDREHELAAGLQTAMLPGHMPPTPGLVTATRYRPASARGGIGGDWYDALTLPDGRIVAVVGDVQGHDVTAAAVMGQLRIALRAYAAEGHPPTTVVARASAFLTELDTDRFATCLLVQIDPRTGRTVIVRAGHLGPVLRGPDGTCTWLDVPGGLPLGLSSPRSQPVHPAAEMVLGAGSTLLLCTDGLVESRAADIDEGRDRLLDALVAGPVEPEGLADHVLDSMSAYTGKEDDVALLVIRRNRRASEVTERLEVAIRSVDPDSLHTARLALRKALTDWSLGPLSETAELLACELATNALLHARGDATLTVSPVPGRGPAVRLAVTDTSPVSPRRRAATERSTSGRGLMLIEELASAWGVESRGTGKSVWCEVTLPPP
ncbi:SpoIIE family protein phosphatase [Streptomyces sp. JHA26]|uniref:SpoIIE family protein phosphatase n=1 Tax=Streptomyces sp. JHA26 TaxID=1917143 RepID=UPI000989DB31|nr:SpoIIE family protein phosphatase [Streptomyces sp. JHA26]